MRRYDDKFIHYAAATLLLLGIFSIFSGYTLPRLVYYTVYYPDQVGLLFHAFKPFVNLGIILLFGGLIYLILSRGVDLSKIKIKGKKIKTKTFVNFFLWTTVVLMVIVVLERFIFHMRFNRWLIGPKHTILITGLAITAYYLFLAYEFSKDRINWPRVIAVSLLFGLLLLMQPDTGTTILLAASFLTLLYVRMPWKVYRWVFQGLALFVLAMATFSIFNAKLNLQLPNIFSHTAFAHITVRINNWLNPFHDVTDRSYQIANSLFAVHKGGLLGVGYGFGTRKLYMGATVHTDFIFATIGEELGFITCTFIFIVTLLLIFRLLTISFHFKSRFEKYFTLLVAIETFAMAFMNAGMAVNLLPSKGWPYPLISYGPFFTVFYIIQLGIIQYMLNKKFYEVYGKRN